MTDTTPAAAVQIPAAGIYWVSEFGNARRHAPGFFVRRADGTGVLVDGRREHDQLTRRPLSGGTHDQVWQGQEQGRACLAHAVLHVLRFFQLQYRQDR